MNVVKTALVTGSSSGIGYGIAKVLLKNGYQVVLHGIESQAQVAPLVKDLSAQGKVLGYYSVDIGDSQAVAQFCNDLAAAGVTIDILVNNSIPFYAALVAPYAGSKMGEGY